MRSLRQLAALLVVVALIAAIAVALFASLALVLAFVGPVLGLSYFAMQLRTARALWQSHGRFQLEEGVRVVPAGRTRAMAALHLVAGTGGLLVGASPTVFVFGPAKLWIPLFFVGIVTVSVAGAASQKVLAGAKGVDVLPPDA